MSDPFAAELKLAISRHLQDDKPALQALSHVSSAWRGPAQAALFCVFNLPVTDFRALSKLISFLQSSPHLTTSISKLRLFNVSIGFPQVVSLMEILSLVSLLPGLHTLAIRGFLIGASREHRSAFNAYPKRPCRLMLSDLSMDPICFHTLITRFTGPSLSVLGIIIQRVKTLDTDSPLPQDVLSATQTLDLGVDEIYALPVPDYDPEKWQLGHLLPEWPNLLSFAPADLKVFGAGCNLRIRAHLDILGEFMKTKGKCMEHLRLDFGQWTLVEGRAEGHESGMNPPIQVHADVDWVADLVGDKEGSEGFGGIPRAWPNIPLSAFSPLLNRLTILLAVTTESEDASNKSAAVLQWRYALRLIASAPRSLTSITIGLYLTGSGLYFMDDVPHDDAWYSTIYMVDWKKWEEVLRGFDKLANLTFIRMDDRSYRRRYYEPYEPRGPLPEAFAKKMKEHVMKDLVSTKSRDALHFV